VNNDAAWNEMYSRLSVAQTICFDTETTCLDPIAPNFKVVGMSLAVDDATGYYVPLNHRPPVQRMMFDVRTGTLVEPIVQLPEKWVIQRLKPLLESRGITGHGLKFDYKAMKVKYGVILRNIVYDTLCASHLLDERGTHKLKLLVEKYLGYKPVQFTEAIAEVEDDSGEEKVDLRKESGFDLVPISRAALYAGPDAVNPTRLRTRFRSQFLASQKLTDLLKMEIQLVPVTAEMELVGTSPDTQHLARMSVELMSEAQKFAEELRLIARNPELNPASNKQMVNLVYDQFSIQRPREQGNVDKGLFIRQTREELVVKIREGRQVNFKGFKDKEHTVPVDKGWIKEEVLRVLDIYNRWARLSKLESVYTTSLIDAVSGDGRLHTLFNQNGTASGRYSSSNPNFQNIPRNTDPKDVTYKYDIRKSFRADPGWVYVLCDYSAMEMRICAAMSGDQVMRGIVTGVSRDAIGEPIDIHLYTAAEAFKLDYNEAAAITRDKKNPRYAEIKEYRQKAKPVNFGIIYGLTEVGLASDLGETVEFARSVIAGFMRAYPGVALWMKQTEEYLRAHLYTETFMGRRRRTSYVEMHDRKLAGRAFRACLNHQIQGTGADIVKQAMINVSSEIVRMRLKAQIAGQIHDEIIVHCPREEYEDVARMMLRCMGTELDGIPITAEAEVKTTWSKMEEPLWKLGA